MSDLLQSLLSAGMSPAIAKRIEDAVRQTAREEQQSTFTAPAGSVNTPAPGTPAAFALYASAPAEYDHSHNTFGRGKAALGVDGLAYVDGQLAVTDDAYAGTLAVGGQLTSQSLGTDSVTTKKISVLNSAEVTDRLAVFKVPITSEKWLTSKAGGQFSGLNNFDGPVVLGNRVFWKGERRPATVDLPSTFSFLEDGGMAIGTKTVAVLNDFGNGPRKDVYVKLLGQTITVLTGATFDTETCAISASTTSIFHCTGTTFSSTSGVSAP